MTERKIPEDFPREGPLAAIPGTQPKLLLRKIGTKLVAGYTEEELLERYGACIDLVEQLIPYSRRKLAANHSWHRAALESRLVAGIRGKNWDFSKAEIDWIVKRVCDGIWPC